MILRARLFHLLAVLLAASSLAAVAEATPNFGTVAPKRVAIEGEPVKSVLWVGNSFFYYNNGINSYMSGLAQAAGDGLAARHTMFTVSGGGIDWQDIDTYLRPGSHVGGYSFIPGNQVRFNKDGRQYDTVVIMDCSQCPIHPQLKGIFHEYAKKSAETARKYGVRPVLFMSWAYKDKPEMTAQLSDAYTSEANADDFLVIPAGHAFARARAKRPDLELYQKDLRHPTVAGTYLAACTSYAALTGRSPVGNGFDGGLGPDLARFLQETAWEAVNGYYGRT